GTSLLDATGPHLHVFHSDVCVRCNPKSEFGWVFAYAAISGNHGPGTMIVDEVASPFSIESITAAFAAWLLPTSSTLIIRTLSVALNPNRSASGEVAAPRFAPTPT